MNPEELEKAIFKLENEEWSNLSFGIFKSEEDDETYIKATRPGLELFALKLLETAQNADTKIRQNNSRILNVDFDERWIDRDSNVVLEYIKIITENDLELNITDDNKLTLLDKLIPYGCGLIAIILIISVIVGLVTIVRFLC